MDRLTIVDGGYRTPMARPGPLARAFPATVFWARALRTFWRSSGRARRGEYGLEEWAASSVEILRALEAVGVSVTVTGMEHFAALEGPCVFVGNHMSTLETLVVPGFIVAMGRPATFVVKRSLVDYPVFRHVMRSRDPIVVGRKNPREDFAAVLEGGTKRLGEGISIIIFPQTTRAVTFDPGAFNTIGIKLARRASVPVVPIALRTDAWGQGRVIKEFGPVDPEMPVHIEFGKPITVRGRGAEEHRQVVEFITSRLRGWGGSVAAPAGALDKRLER